MDGLVRYRGWIADTAPWADVPLRDDDVIVTVPSKSGTTWMQTLVALLLFDGVPDQPVYDLSPWLDMHTRTAAEVLALLDAQEHRRFIKTHAPLDGLPWHDDVTYVTVGRDPRDVFVSMLAHGANLDRQRTRAIRVATAGEDAPDDPWPDSDDPRDLVTAFLTIEQYPDHTDVNLANVLHHLRLAWEARDRDNVHLTHYVDLRADLVGEMLLLRDVLGVDRDDDRVAELAGLATLESMRARAHDVAPEANMDVWQDPAAFFRGGRHGDGAGMMTADELRRYDERCRELVDDEAFLAWVHGGREGGGTSTAG